MKPAAFDYAAPGTVEEVLNLLAEFGDDAKILAGGQTLGPMLNLRVVSPSVLVDINRLDALRGRRTASGGTSIGALTCQAALEDDARLRRDQPLIAQAIPLIAHRPIRNRGTVGGSLAHADPAAEWGALALALDAEFVVVGKAQPPRTISATDFFLGPLTTVLEPDELLVEIRLPAWQANHRGYFLEFSRRHGDFALAGIACRMSLNPTGHLEDPRVAAFGVGDTPLRITAAEQLLAGQKPGAAGLGRAVGEAVARDVEPMDDLHASAEYRRHLIGVLAEQAIDRASNHEAKLDA